MRLAFICTERLTVPPLRGGAIQIFIDGITPYVSTKHELTIYCTPDPELPEREIINGVRYIRVPREGYAYGVAKRLTEEEQPYDLIHVYNRPKDLLIYKHAMPDSRFVVSLHNEMFNESRISDQLGDLAIRIADGIMSISNYIGQTIVTRFPFARSKISTVYSGIDLNRFVPVWSDDAGQIRKELRKKYGVEHNKVVLFVGRLSKVKGPDVLIHAMEQVIQQHPDAVLVIIGNRGSINDNDRLDEYMTDLHLLAEALGDKRVVFTNFVSPSQIPSHYLIGDLFVCSSQWEEPLARVHYEAMGAGLPIITTRRGGNAEIINHLVNGIVIDDYTNPQAFADAITFLLTHPEDAGGLAKAGRAAAEANFGFQIVAERLEKLYGNAMNKQRL
ncbi:glycosyltransferase family 4 protein [Paenibacillus sedimenti]|uniref:Glycosyltransferase family 4 protein n=1 Tax=Paenibacillus sedimenti TaxID=2770274 RepID=A0A926QJH2_9BACL|nr:glycosyltransferase family 4 protein [Paenibacillus sedimenti]MBD0381550.1 glycosyltransferase family 4 protein [Paenibacillus sedimenti]